jgi:hypothetical protein
LSVSDTNAPIRERCGRGYRWSIAADERIEANSLWISLRVSCRVGGLAMVAFRIMIAAFAAWMLVEFEQARSA